MASYPKGSRESKILAKNAPDARKQSILPISAGSRRHILKAALSFLCDIFEVPPPFGFNQKDGKMFNLDKEIDRFAKKLVDKHIECVVFEIMTLIYGEDEDLWNEYIKLMDKQAQIAEPTEANARVFYDKLRAAIRKML